VWFAQAEEAHAAYYARIAELQRLGPEIAHTEGRDALIQRYRELIEAYPESANNIRLETQIALIYASDFSEAGQPPEPQTAYETLLRIIQTYDPENPYMKDVRKMAAERAREQDPEVAVRMYESIIADYPGEDALVVESTYELAKLAESRGDTKTANAHYEQILGYVPVGGSSEAEQEAMHAYESNAVASLLTSAIRAHEDPVERLRAMREFLREHDELAKAHAQLIQRVLSTLERYAREHETEELHGAIRAALASAIAGEGVRAGEGRGGEAGGTFAVSGRNQMRVAAAETPRDSGAADEAAPEGEGVTRAPAGASQGAGSRRVVAVVPIFFGMVLLLIFAVVLMALVRRLTQ
jgi:tetratricopeptide (TPR) repeat protein